MESHRERDFQKKRTTAFLPFTWNGIARFGYADRVFLFSVETIVAFVCALCALWLFCGSYFPVVTSFVQALPESPAKISEGRLHWDDREGALAQSSKLAMVINTYGDARSGRESDITLELTEHQLKIHSFGYYTEIPYGNSVFFLNRKQAIPWWQAWMGPVIFWVWFIAMFVQMLCWQVLSFLYMFPIKLISWILKRKRDWVACYSLAGAVQMPGALLLGLALLGYESDLYKLEGLLLAVAIHFFVAWFFLFTTPLFLPAGVKPKPFFSSNPLPTSQNKTDVTRQDRKKNPFSSQSAKTTDSYNESKKNPFK